MCTRRRFLFSALPALLAAPLVVACQPPGVVAPMTAPNNYVWVDEPGADSPINLTIRTTGNEAKLAVHAASITFLRKQMAFVYRHLGKAGPNPDGKGPT